MRPRENSAARRLSRREFLKRQMQYATWVTLGLSGLAVPRPAIASGTADIGIVVGRPAAAVRAAVELLGGMATVVKPGDKVIVKPNMSFPGGTRLGANTTPEIVREVVALCLEAGAARIRVLDNTLGNPDACISDIRETCEKIKEGIVHAVSDGDFFRQVNIGGQGAIYTNSNIMKDVLDADVIIAVPTAKSHGQTGVSLSMKGMMGLVHDRMTMHQVGLDDAIVNLANFLRPKLVLVDATRVLSTNGPRGPGKVLKTDTVIASRDMVAADAQTVSMFEWYGRRMKPRQVRHILLAHEMGIGRMDIENLLVKKIDLS